MVAYQTESDLVELIRPHYNRVEDEGRTFIQMALQDTADIEPAEDQLRITLAPLSSPHRSRGLEALRETLNKTNMLFPGTRLQMYYVVAPIRYVPMPLPRLPPGFSNTTFRAPWQRHW
jgi:hypothetical protein